MSEFYITQETIDEIESDIQYFMSLYFTAKLICIICNSLKDFKYKESDSNSDILTKNNIVV